MKLTDAELTKLATFYEEAISKRLEKLGYTFDFLDFDYPESNAFSLYIEEFQGDDSDEDDYEEPLTILSTELNKEPLIFEGFQFFHYARSYHIRVDIEKIRKKFTQNRLPKKH